MVLERKAKAGHRAFMPQALQADWNLIRDLYSKGMTPSKIADQTGVQVGTICSRASRGRWKAVAQQANSIVQVEIQHPKQEPESPESSALAKASASVRAALSQELLRSVAALDTLKPSKRLESQRERANVVQTITGTAKTVFGWSDGQSNPSVRINVLSSFAIEPAQQPEQGKVIDVTPALATPKPIEQLNPPEGQ